MNPVRVGEGGRKARGLGCGGGGERKRGQEIDAEEKERGREREGRTQEVETSDHKQEQFSDETPCRRSVESLLCKFWILNDATNPLRFSPPLFFFFFLQRGVWEGVLQSVAVSFTLVQLP